MTFRALTLKPALRLTRGRARELDAVEHHDPELLHLVHRARGGDHSAFTELWESCAPVVHGIFLSMVPEQEAEDLMQDAALRAWRAIGSLENPARFSPWLCTIARNLGRNALLAKSAEPSRSLDDELRASLKAEVSNASGSPEASEILARLRSLPEAYREPLTLRLVLDLSGPEIAERTGLTPGSVRVNLCRGLKLLRERLEAEGNER